MILISTEKWNRKEHFEFFSQMDQPFLGITTTVDCTDLLDLVKKEKQSLFASYLHGSMKAIHEVAAFKHRIIDNEVYELETIHAGATISREDHTFAFIFAEYSPNFEIFNRNLQTEILEVQHSTGLRLNGDDTRVDLIRHTCIPWIRFTDLQHPTRIRTTDSVPRISFGKITLENGRAQLPVSVVAHHGLVDSYPIHLYLEAFEEFLH